MGALWFISPQHHCNFNYRGSLPVFHCISLFLKKAEPGLTKMTTVICFLCLLEVALSTFTNVKALKKHKQTST